MQTDSSIARETTQNPRSIPDVDVKAIRVTEGIKKQFGNNKCFLRQDDIHYSRTRTGLVDVKASTSCPQGQASVQVKLEEVINNSVLISNTSKKNSGLQNVQSIAVLPCRDLKMHSYKATSFHQEQSGKILKVLATSRISCKKVRDAHVAEYLKDLFELLILGFGTFRFAEFEDLQVTISKRVNQAPIPAISRLR